MNPSAAGWIPKFLSGLDQTNLIDQSTHEYTTYQRLKTTGFIYGVSIRTLLDHPISELKLTIEEYSKINLFHAMLFTYFNENPVGKFDEAIIKIIGFYKNIDKGKKGFFQKLSLSHTPAANLEQIIAARLHESNSVLKSNTANILTHALLYVDVLAFRVYLKSAKQLKSYIKNLESTIIICTILALESKKVKNKYDLLLLDLFHSYSSDIKEIVIPEDVFTVIKNSSFSEKDELEKRYLLDLCCLAVKGDNIVENREIKFLKHLNSALDLEENTYSESIKDLEQFTKLHATKIQLFEYAHPVSRFYKHSTQTVKQLILRNKNRLIKELHESGDLILLLRQSTIRDLSKSEKTKMKKQLLDIFKTVPSLAIFLLPGGLLLLPLMVKLIPQLLPTAFDENRIKPEKK